MFRTKQMVRLALLVAVAILLFYFVSFPLPFFPAFLTYDAGDIPGLVAALAMGPLAGVVVQFLKAFLGLLMGASKAGWIGALANFLAGGTMVLVTGLIYKLHKTKAQAILAMFAGCVATAVIMGAANYFWLLPLWGIPNNEVLPLLASAIIPFNFVKFAITSFVTFLLYKKVKNLLEA